jgi:hypothetical protein
LRAGGLSWRWQHRVWVARRLLERLRAVGTRQRRHPAAQHFEVCSFGVARIAVLQATCLRKPPGDPAQCVKRTQQGRRAAPPPHVSGRRRPVLGDSSVSAIPDPRHDSHPTPACRQLGNWQSARGDFHTCYIFCIAPLWVWSYTCLRACRGVCAHSRAPPPQRVALTPPCRTQRPRTFESRHDPAAV